MFKLISFFVLVAAVSGGVVPAAPLIASGPAALALPAPIVTARSSQVIARNYNTFAAAPLAVAPVAPFAAAPAAAVAHLAAPLTYAAPAAAYAALPAPIKYAAPLTYAAAHPAQFIL